MQWALIFDVDGVVADTETLNARASALMMRQLYGAEVQPEEYREFVGTGDERYVEGVAEKHGVTIDTEAAVERRRQNFFELLKDHPLPAMPGVMAIVQAARVSADVGLAIATSGNADKQFPVIEGTGLKLEWFDPERCIVFEDAPAGVAAARAAGMICVAITGSVEADKLADADLVVDSLAELSLAKLRGMALSR